MVHPDLCPREEFEPYFQHLLQLDLRAYFALARDLLSHDASALLSEVRVPTLVVAGERDLFTPVARSRELAERIPGAELLVVRGGTHAALVEQPELISLAVEKFLRLHGVS
jgi:pimeloyl-ACP methyl ester carboxylesterase